MTQKHDITSFEDIQLLVNIFYSNLQENKELNYIFNKVAQVQWDQHLPKMYRFWETILFHQASYKGNPIIAHQHIHQIYPFKEEHFAEWLAIFRSTLYTLFEGENTNIAMKKAENIAQVLKIKLQTSYE